MRNAFIIKVDISVLPYISQFDLRKETRYQTFMVIQIEFVYILYQTNMFDA